MNYNKIRELCELRGISIPDLASRINLTKSGLYLAISKKTLTVEKLELIAQIFDVPIWTFFDLDPELPFTKTIKQLTESNKKLDQYSTDLEIQLDQIKYKYDVALYLLEQFDKAGNMMIYYPMAGKEYFNIVLRHSNYLRKDIKNVSWISTSLGEQLLKLANAKIEEAIPMNEHNIRDHE